MAIVIRGETFTTEEQLGGHFHVVANSFVVPPQPFHWDNRFATTTNRIRKFLYIVFKVLYFSYLFIDVLSIHFYT